MTKPAYIAAREAARQKSGEFGTQLRGEVAVDLVDAPINWGNDPDVVVGQSSMWGPVDQVETLAPGVVRAHTASHGGYKLSPERNAAIPAALREPSAWYEEDGEVYIVAMYHPDAFSHWGDPEDLAAHYAEGKVRYWFPQAYEHATGIDIPFGESAEKDASVFRDEQADGWQLPGGGDHNYYTGDDGVRYVRLHRVGDPKQNVWVEMSEGVQKEIEKSRGDFGAAKAYQLPAIVGSADMANTVGDPRPGLVKHHGIKDYSNRSAASQAKIEKDLNKRWRDDDGQVRTLREIIENEGVSEKKVTVENGRRTYNLSQQVEYGSSTWTALKVSKDTWDTVDAPDNRTPVDEAREGYLIASDKYEKARDKVDGSWRASTDDLKAVREAGLAVKAAKAKLDEVRDSYTAELKAKLTGKTA